MLELALVDGFTPAAGQQFEIIDVNRTRSGTFAGLPRAADITVTRQVLAEPTPDLAERTWASLAHTSITGLMVWLEAVA